MTLNLDDVKLGEGRTALDIVAGQYHTYAELDNQTVKCWGNNTSGQLGSGDTTDRSTADTMGSNLPSVDTNDY